MVVDAPFPFAHLISGPCKFRFFATTDKDWALVLSVEGESDRFVLPRHLALSDREFTDQVLVKPSNCINGNDTRP